MPTDPLIYRWYEIVSVYGSTIKELSLEELMQIDVTSVSKRSEQLSRAAAAIIVITRDDLRRSGVTSLPEALRLANGLEVARETGLDHEEQALLSLLRSWRIRRARAA